MPDVTDIINPQTLKYARKRRGMSQKELADAIREIAKGCSKDTVSRWERGESRRLHPRFRKALCEVLRIPWEKLVEPRDQPLRDATTKVSMGKGARNSLRLVAERYDVRPQDVLDLAPLLFLIIAERSLLERQRQLQKLDAALQESETLLENSGHIGGIIANRSVFTDDQLDLLDEEKQSLGKGDVFGRITKHEYRNEGPFAHFVRDLTKDLAKDAVVHIESFGGDMIETYRIADDTLQACTGISEDEKQGHELLRHIHCGAIDLAECLRKRDGDEETYRQWLSAELSRAEEESEEESRRQIEKFFRPIVAATGEPDAARNRSEK